MSQCVETLPTKAGFVFERGAPIEWMSDVELDWIFYRNQEVSIAEFSRDLTIGYTLMDTGGVTEEPMGAFLMYPVRFEDEFVLGRAFCVTGFFQTMYPREDILEERFVVNLRGPVPHFIITTRMSSGRTLIQEYSVFDFFVSRKTQLYEVSMNNWNCQRPIMSMIEKFLCYHCSEKNVECKCPPRASIGEMELFEEIYDKAASPCAKWLAWTSLFGIAERLNSRMFFTLTPILYSDNDFGPAPFTFRKSYRFASDNVDIDFMFQDHLGLMSARPRQSVSGMLLCLTSSEDQSDHTESAAIGIEHPGSPESVSDPPHSCPCFRGRFRLYRAAYLSFASSCLTRCGTQTPLMTMLQRAPTVDECLPASMKCRGMYRRFTSV
mmetsp:Transcript_21398/g.87386  ORF Transcript_21398/g.87386 Transcript_21398/m.87386 type:complete len:379 (-) Transcript_21398:463-1599(-)